MEAVKNTLFHIRSVPEQKEEIWGRFQPVTTFLADSIFYKYLTIPIKEKMISSFKPFLPLIGNAISLLESVLNQI